MKRGTGEDEEYAMTPGGCGGDKDGRERSVRVWLGKVEKGTLLWQRWASWLRR